VTAANVACMGKHMASGPLFGDSGKLLAFRVDPACSNIVFSLL